MTCNAFRFGLSTILLVACLPMIPIDEPELGAESEDDQDLHQLLLKQEQQENEGSHDHGGVASSPGGRGQGAGAGGAEGSLHALKSVSRDTRDMADGSGSSSSGGAKRQPGKNDPTRPSFSGTKSNNLGGAARKVLTACLSCAAPFSLHHPTSPLPIATHLHHHTLFPPPRAQANVLIKLLGPVGLTKMRSIKKTVWFWGVLLGLINFCGRSVFVSHGVGFCVFVSSAPIYYITSLSPPCLLCPQFNSSCVPVVSRYACSGFQQWGISLTSASKCAFIAGFDLFLTPVFSLFVPTFKVPLSLAACLPSPSRPCLFPRYSLLS